MVRATTGRAFDASWTRRGAGGSAPCSSGSSTASAARRWTYTTTSGPWPMPASASRGHSGIARRSPALRPDGAASTHRAGRRRRARTRAHPRAYAAWHRTSAPRRPPTRPSAPRRTGRPRCPRDAPLRQDLATDRTRSRLHDPRSKVGCWKGGAKTTLANPRHCWSRSLVTQGTGSRRPARLSLAGRPRPVTHSCRKDTRASAFSQSSAT